jgi:hypothetical protein
VLAKICPNVAVAAFSALFLVASLSNVISPLLFFLLPLLSLFINSSLVFSASATAFLASSTASCALPIISSTLLPMAVNALFVFSIKF